MPRGGSGSYSLPSPFPSGFQNGTTIDAPTMNSVFTDVQTALTASTAADGQTPITGNWNWKGYSILGLGGLVATSVVATDAATSKSMTVGNGLNVTAGGATITAGGLTVTAGGLTVSGSGMAVTGNSTVIGSLTGITTLGVASGGAAITGDSTVTGKLTVTSTAAVTGTLTAANGTSGSQVVNYGQFPVTLASPGTLTLPSGLIMKWGTGTYTAGTGTVTFAANFPTSLLIVHCSLLTGGAAHGSYPPGASPASYAVSGFTVYGGTGQNGSFAWLALGC